MSATLTVQSPLSTIPAQHVRHAASAVESASPAAPRAVAPRSRAPAPPRFRVLRMRRAGAAAEGTRGFENVDLVAGSGEFDGGGQSRVAGTDDGEFQARNQVLPASQSLRSGGREMRWSSTR